MAHAQKPDLVFRRNGRVHLNRQGGRGLSVQSTADSRGVRISSSNAGYTKFRGCVKLCEGDWLPTPFASFPFTSPPVRHRVPSRFNWTLHRTLEQLFLNLTQRYKGPVHGMSHEMSISLQVVIYCFILRENIAVM